MKHLDLLNEFRDLISQLRSEVEAASAMQLYDTHRVSEQAICGVIRELYDFTGLRSLNKERSNFPGIDLADDGARVAIQVTATADLVKIKSTLDTFIRHKLHQKYDRLIIYVLTSKQGSYSQSAIDVVSKSQFSLHADKDIWDYRDLCTDAAEAPPKALLLAINHLKAYLHGAPAGLADEDIDPPLQPAESLIANLLSVYFPSDLHIAQLSAELMERHKKSRSGYLRKSIRAYCKDNGFSIPSAYIAHAGSLITFMDLSDPESPYRYLIAAGTEEVFAAGEFCDIDQDHERVFKSLLRLSLQQRLFAEHVLWYNDEKQFVFLPREADNDVREEEWIGDKKSKRAVFVRKYNEKNHSKISMQKHFSFEVDFHRIEDSWFMSIIPNWFFSFGKDYRKSGSSHNNLSWIKRQENNRAVLNHFRFIVAWLKSIDDDDLFSQAYSRNTFLSFGDKVSLDGSPYLDESKWTALPEISEADYTPHTTRLFGK